MVHMVKSFSIMTSVFPDEVLLGQKDLKIDLLQDKASAKT